jgi:2-desacetyl-2-hydroxyethyl bacteriochlorophyllide A dehydrogenase
VIHTGVNLSPTEDLREAIVPLLEEGVVDALEWSVDMGFGGVPGWADALLGHYAAEGRLVAHGVELSLLTVGQRARRERWMLGLDRQLARYRFAHLTEHHGIMTAGAIVGGTPLPHPRSAAAVAVGRARLAELRTRARVPVGLENLALAFSRRDVDEQPDFLEAMLEPDGILLLDLHNLLCQAESFGVDPHALLARYPLHRARELHVAGGSHFVPRSGAPMRRDDHERDVPDACFDLLDDALERCKDVSWVVLEHADGMLRTPAHMEAFRATYHRVRERVTAASARREQGGAPREARPFDVRAADDAGEAELAALEAAQEAYLETIDDAADGPAALARVRADSRLASFGGWLDAIEPRAMELAHVLVARWGERAAPREPDARAAVLEAPGVIRFREVAPAPLAAGEVRLEVEACGVCGTDLHLFRGRLVPSGPLVLGHETVGCVVETGEGVTSLSVGDRVGVPWAQGSCGACAACKRGHARYCDALRTWINMGGGQARFVRAVANACVRIPDGLGSAEAAPLFCAGHTVASGLVRARATSGEHVAVVGIGGLGHLAIQIARALGARVTAVTRSASKRRDALALGAHEVLVTDTPGDALARAGGADVIVATKARTTEAGPLVRGLSPCGRLVVAGLAFQPLDIDAGELIARGASVIAALGEHRKELEWLVDLARDGAVRAMVEVHRPAQLRTAIHRLEDGRIRYRAVISRSGGAP